MDQQSSPLVCPAHTTSYIGIFLIGVTIGAGASFAYLRQAPVGTENTYQAGFDAAKKRVEESNLGMMFRTPDDIRNISGTVTAVSGNRITLHTQRANPFEDPALDDRTILVTADTKIFKLSQKDPKVMQAEMEAFAKTAQAGLATMPTTPTGTMMTPPEPFTRTSATISSITIGDTLDVTAAENIKTMKEFSASEIQFQAPMSVPTLVPPTTAPIN